MDPGPISFTLLLPFTFTRTVYFLAYYYPLPLDTLNPLFTANRWDWQPHRKLVAKFLVVLCAGSTLLLVQSKALDETLYKLSGAVAKLAGITFWSLVFSYWFDKPWFHNWGKTSCCAHHTFLLKFPTGCYLHAISILLWIVGEHRRGVTEPWLQPCAVKPRSGVVVDYTFRTWQRLNVSSEVSREF
jgi:hypothetical protein